MNPSTQAGIFAALAILIIAVLAAGRRAGRLRRPFALVCLALLLIHLGIVLQRLSGAWGELSFFGGLLLPLALLALIASMLGVGGVRLKWTLRVSLALVFVVGLSHLWSPVDLLGRSIETLERQYPHAWPAARALYLFGSTLLVLGMILVRSLSEPSALVRRQQWWTFGAGLLAWTLNAAVLWFDSETWQALAALSQVLFLYVFYLAAVERSRLSLAELLGKLAAFAASALVLALVFGLLVYWAGSEPLRFVLSIFAAGFMVLLLYEPLVGRIARGVSGLFQRDRLVMGRMLSRLQSETVTLTEPQQLARFVSSELARGVGAKGAALYAVSEGGELDPFSDVPGPQIHGSSGLVTQLASSRAVLTLAGLGEQIYDALGRGRRDERVALEAVRTLLKDAGYEVAVPIRARGRLLAAWLLAPQRAGAYGAEELDVLRALGDQIGLKLDSLQVLAEFRHSERLAAMGQMAAGLAHELKNPLGSLSGAAQMIDAQELPEQQRQWLRIVLEDTDRLKAVLERFLDYARPSPLRRERFDPLSLARRTCELLRADPALARAQLSCQEHGDPTGELYADPEQVGQVLINLVLNAAQIAAGREVRIELAIGRQVRAGSDGVLFAVRDDGPGIDPADHDKIFTPFYTKRRGGTGLGLATCRRIVEAHGGIIEAAQPDGPGALIRFWLPDRRATHEVHTGEANDG
ncbi:MAG: ATP-binding protein [Candidatus Alcyoniella australis]|nr:ATP-binding protein [Candidatus Alcyoniella australis]